MMGDRLIRQESLFYQFRLDDHVPADHLQPLEHGVLGSDAESNAGPGIAVAEQAVSRDERGRGRPTPSRR